MQEQLERDLKTALLSGDKNTVETLKGLKTAFQYEAVAKRIKPAELSPEELQAVISREAKKRQEAAQLYKNAGEDERAAKELGEKEILSKYLPEQMTDEELSTVVDAEYSKLSEPSMKDMGQLISIVKSLTAGKAEGGTIARLVKERLSQQ